MRERANPVVIVRHALPGDIDELMAMCREHAIHEREPVDRVARSHALAGALFDAPTRLTAWIAVGHGCAIGYATASNEFSTWPAREYLHMDCLFVRAGHRGAGVGAALLAAVTQYARDNGHAEVQWQTPDWNEDAARFYRRSGAIAHAKIRFALNLEERTALV